MGKNIKTIEDLRNNGFDVDMALHFCANKESIYRAVLDTALQEGREKLEVLRKYVTEENYKRYYIEVHAVKNVANTIGASQLFKIALADNEAMKKSDYEYTRAHYEELLTEYKRVLDVIEDFLNE